MLVTDPRTIEADISVLLDGEVLDSDRIVLVNDFVRFDDGIADDCHNFVVGFHHGLAISRGGLVEHVTGFEYGVGNSIGSFFRCWLLRGHCKDVSARGDDCRSDAAKYSDTVRAVRYDMLMSDNFAWYSEVYNFSKLLELISWLSDACGSRDLSGLFPPTKSL